MPELLATLDDLREIVQRDITEDEAARCEALLRAASATVRSYTGQQFTAGESTVRLKVRRGRVRLPQRPVTDVDSVVDTSDVDVEHTWYAGDSIDVSGAVPDAWSYEPRATPLQYVDVTYSHGYEAIPDDIIAVVCQIAARALDMPAEHAGVTSETVGDSSISYGSTAGAGLVGMFPDEKLILDRYRRPGTTASIG